MSAPIDPVTVTVQPRDAYLFDTPFGMGDLLVGTTDSGDVAMVLTPPAASVLAQVIARATPNMTHDGVRVDHDADPDVWAGVVVDLLASAAMCGPKPEPVYASGGYLPPKGRRS